MPATFTKNLFQNTRLATMVVAAICVTAFPVVLPAQQDQEGVLTQLQDDQQQESEAEQNPEKADKQELPQEPKTDEKSSDENKGQADLDKAFELKVGATSTRDLDRVADLCESAIDKGLTAGAEEQARQLWASVLYDYAKQLDNQIFRANQDRRWRVYRREALKRLEKVVELRPDKTDAYIMIARLHSLPGGDKVAANSAIETAIEQITDDNKTLSEAIFIRATLADDDQARLADLTQAIKIDPKNIDAVRERGRYYLQNEKFDEAMADFTVWLEEDPTNVPRHMAVAETFRALKRYDEASAVMEMAVKENDEDTRVYTLLGQIYSESERNDKALEALKKAIQLDRRNLDALIIRCSVLLEKDRLDDALEDANEVLKLEPDSPRGKWIRSIIYGAKEDYAKAIEDVEQLLELFPTNPDFQSQLAMLYNADERPSKAIEIYDQIIDQDTKDAQPIRGRGDAKLSLGMHKDAIADYEAALKFLPAADKKDLEPRQKDQLAGILNNLAWVLATSTIDELRDGQRALKLATQASELTDYKKAFILSTLASTYAEIDDFENAVKWAEKAVEFSESDEQRENLTKELESYQNKKPWREMENVEQKKKDQAEKSDQPQSQSTDENGAEKVPAGDSADSGAQSEQSADDKAKAGENDQKKDESSGGGN